MTKVLRQTNSAFSSHHTFTAEANGDWWCCRGKSLTGGDKRWARLEYWKFALNTGLKEMRRETASPAYPGYALIWNFLLLANKSISVLYP